MKKDCPWKFDPDTGRPIDYGCDQENRPKYRKTDGTCNLLSSPHLGSSMTPFQRILAADYSELPNGRNGLRGGGRLPNARDLSNKLVKATTSTEGQSAFMTVFVMQMGQFIGKYDKCKDSV